MNTKIVIAALVMFSAQLLKAQSKVWARINHVAIFVTDLKQSRAFYTHLIGLDTVAEPFHDGKHVWLDLGSGVSLHIIAGADKRREYFQNSHLCVSISNMKDFIGVLRQRKIPWYNARGEEGKATTRVDGVTQVWIQDPDGYWIEMNNDVNTAGRK